LAPAIRSSYLVCATPRSGSTLLCKLLAATGVAGRPEEYFERLRHSGLPRQPREFFDGAEDPGVLELLAPTEPGHPDGRDPLDEAIELGTTPNGVFGAKLMWGYLGDFADLLRGVDGLERLPVPELLERTFPNLSYLQITRQDKFRQAVSLWKAVQTQAWKRDDAPCAEPVFSFRAINYLVRLLTAHDASWDAYFLGLGRQPLKITYEELAEAPEPVVRRVLDHLGIDAPDDLRLDAPRLEVQADEISEEWVRRVHEHLTASEA
jgi:trehalose 2-sulfotransferase